MATGSFPGAKSGELKGNDLAIEHGNQPADGAHKALARLLPIHIFWPVESGNLFWKKFRENFGSWASFFRDLCGKVFALWCSDFLQLFDIHASFFGEGVGRRSRLAVLESDRHRWPRCLFGDIGLRGRNARGNQRQPSWRVETLNDVRRR